MSIFAAIFDLLYTIGSIVVTIMSIVLLYLFVFHSNVVDEFVNDTINEAMTTENQPTTDTTSKVEIALQHSKRASKLTDRILESDTHDPEYVAQKLREANRHHERSLDALQDVHAPGASRARRKVRRIISKNKQTIQSIHRTTESDADLYSNLDTDTDGIDRLRK